MEDNNQHQHIITHELQHKEDETARKRMKLDEKPSFDGMLPSLNGNDGLNTLPPLSSLVTQNPPFQKEEKITLPSVKNLLEQVNMQQNTQTSRPNSIYSPQSFDYYARANQFLSSSTEKSEQSPISLGNQQQLYPNYVQSSSENQDSRSTANSNNPTSNPAQSYKFDRAAIMQYYTNYHNQPNFKPHNGPLTIQPQQIKNATSKNVERVQQNTQALYLQQSSPAEQSPTSRFTLLDEPHPLQRKSYASENRCLLPNPLIICHGKLADVSIKLPKILGGTVSVRLVNGDGQDLPQNKMEILENVGAGLVQALDESLSACFALKVTDTSEGQTFRLRFQVRYRVAVPPSSTKDYEEFVLSRPFVVYSNKHNRTKRKKD